MTCNFATRPTQATHLIVPNALSSRTYDCRRSASIVIPVKSNNNMSSCYIAIVPAGVAASVCGRSVYDLVYLN